MITYETWEGRGEMHCYENTRAVDFESIGDSLEPGHIEESMLLMIYLKLKSKNV